VKDSRAVWRIAIVCVLTAFFAAMSLPDIVLPWHPFSSFGFDADANGRVEDVRPNSPAADSRLRPGDTIDIGATAMAARRYLITPYMTANAGQRATFPVIDTHGAHYNLSLTARVVNRSTLDNVADVAQILSYAIFLLVAAALVLLRPGGLTWVFFAYSLFAAGAGVTVESRAPFVIGVAVLCIGAIQGLAWLPFALFALRFPTDRVDGWRLIAQRTLMLSAVVLIPIAAYSVLGELFVGTYAFAANLLLLQFLPILGFFLGAAIFIATYVHADAIDRPRIRWVILGFFVGYGGLVAASALDLIGIASVPIWLNDLIQTLNVAVPLTVAYAIVKHRVIEITFYLNRALVYGLLTTIAVGIMALLHWVVSMQMEGFHLGVLFELAGALAIGFSILKMHGWIETLVDRYVFRSVHDAEAHLVKINDSMMYAQSLEGLDRLVCAEPRRAFKLAWAEVFHATASGSYRRSDLAGDEATHTEFDRDDAIVLQMCSSRLPVATPDSIAFPLVIRDEILGFALYSVHANGSAIDPNEREILDTFIHRASIAYDHLISKSRAAENARLRVENDTLRSLITSR
jgi:hypothetical protein